jgi:mevalonate kinase
MERGKADAVDAGRLRATEQLVAVVAKLANDSAERHSQFMAEHIALRDAYHLWHVEQMTAIKELKRLAAKLLDNLWEERDGD